MMKLDLGGEGEKKCTKHQRLLVELVEAKDYLSKNKQEEIAPFVVLHCFGERKRAGNIHRSILNPFWGEQYAFNVQGGCQRREGERLTATILVENEGKGKDYPLGDVEVDVGRVKEEGVVREWFPLSGQDVGKSYVDGELQVFLGLLSSSMLEGGKEGWFLDVHIAKLRNFLTKRSGISEIFIRFQVFIPFSFFIFCYCFIYFFCTSFYPKKTSLTLSPSPGGQKPLPHPSCPPTTHRTPLL